MACQYQPYSRPIPISLHDDGDGYLALKDVNALVLNYPALGGGTPQSYTYAIQLPSGLSMRDDLILYCLRSKIVLMNSDGYILSINGSIPPPRGMPQL